MQPVKYERARGVDEALTLGRKTGAAFYAGGTLLIDLMKLDVMRPATVVDINALPLTSIEERWDWLRFGALVRMSDAADDRRVRARLPALAQALTASASGQLRNMASLAGNVMQRTRCAYFRDVAAACNKREPGSGCGALHGINAEHAVLGTSERCIAVHASDLAVTLIAFDASFNIDGPAGPRSISAAEFFVTPGETPERETSLRHGELILSIDVPTSGAAANSTYLKVRERTSYAFALASCAAGVDRRADGTIADARIALGGVATVPWRARASEALLRDRLPDQATFAAAARAAFADARPTLQNRYKIDLGIRAIVRALTAVTA